MVLALHRRHEHQNGEDEYSDYDKIRVGTRIGRRRTDKTTHMNTARLMGVGL